MRVKILLFLFVTVAFAGKAQYQIGHRTETLIDSSRSRSIDVEIFYPSNTAGDNVAVAAGTFPVLAFGHGFVMTVDAYNNIRDEVVPAGYILILPKTEGSFSPSHSALGTDLVFCIREMKRRGNESISPFYNSVDTASCVMGHSMGGGASFIAAASDSSITALLNFAAAETNPSAIAAAANITQPSLLFTGANDCVTPPATNQNLMFNALLSSCKTLINIIGGSHCQMAENNFLCGIGESSCTPAPAISRADQHLIINRYMVNWLNYILKGDCAAGSTFLNDLTNDSSVNSNFSCSLCPVKIDEYNPQSVSVFPNPFSDELSFSTGSNIVSRVKIFNIAGIEMPLNSESVVSLGKINTSGLSPGFYILVFDFDGSQIHKQIIKKY